MTRIRDIATYIDNLFPGDRVDYDDLPEDTRDEIIFELEARGYTVDSRNRLGLVEDCDVCEGEGHIRHSRCPQCRGAEMTINYGEKKEPYYG